MEGRVLVTEAVSARGKLSEVFRGVRDDVIEEPELDTASLFAVDGDVELRVATRVMVWVYAQKDRRVSKVWGRR